MLMSRIIPCLDSDKGTVVKGIQFENLRPLGAVAAFAARYEAGGADELVLLDITATLEDRAHWTHSIIEIRELLSIPLTVGGGIKTLQDCERVLRAGADKVSLNTAAVLRPELITELAEEFGCQCVVVAIDAVSTGLDRWELTTHSGTSQRPHSATDWANEAAERGAGELLVTSRDRDGTREGYDIGLIQQVAQAVRVPIVASGGASTWEDFFNAYQAGANGLLAASIFHDNVETIDSLKRSLALAGVPVRQ
jgi:cyclase